MESAVVIALALLAAGVALLVAEVFIPSGGVIGLLSALCFVGGGVFAFRAWFEPSPAKFWMFIASEAALVPISAGLSFWLLARTRFGKRLFLEAPSLEEVTPHSQETARLTKLVGKRGNSITQMSPGGLVLVDGERLHAETEGLMIDADAPIQVIAIKGNRIVVRQADPNDSGSETDTADSTTNNHQPSQERTADTVEGTDVPLDFEVPGG